MTMLLRISRTNFVGLLRSSTQNLNSLPNQQPSLFATSIGQYTQQQQPVPGVRVTTAELRPTTRFNDLHEQLQTLIENVDSFIQQQMKYQQECAGLNTSIDANCAQIPGDVEYCTKALKTMQYALENDAEAIADAKVLTKGDVANSRLNFNAIENMAVPQQFQATNLWALPGVSQNATPSLLEDEDLTEGTSSTNLVSFFSVQADEISASMDDYKKNMGEVESYLKGVEASTMHQIQQLMFTHGRNGEDRTAEDQVRELAAVLKEFEAGILGVASKVGGVREMVQEAMLGNHETLYAKTQRYVAL